MTNNRVTLFATALAGVASIFLALSSTAPAADAVQASENKAIAVVNGTVLTERDLVAFSRAVAASRGGQQLPRTEALNTLIDRELLFEDAMNKGIEKQPEVVRALDDQKRAFLANVDVSEALRSRPITEQDLRKLYDERVLPAAKGNEYKARHILVKTEGEAKDIISQLNKGGDFSDLAKNKSIDTGSAIRGGDLGWFLPKQMVPEFSKAAASLQKGQYTKVPVKSQFGWHVIMLDDVRPVTPPKFDDVKGRLEGLAQSQRLSGYVNALRKRATIEIK